MAVDDTGIRVTAVVLHDGNTTVASRANKTTNGSQFRRLHFGCIFCSILLSLARLTAQLKRIGTVVFRQSTTRRFPGLVVIEGTE